MSRRAKNGNGKPAKPSRQTTRPRGDAAGNDGLLINYWKACELARDGQYLKARAIYARLERTAKADKRLHILIQNDLAVLAAMEGNLHEACDAWRATIDQDRECLPARLEMIV
jgi:hypothetical protein